MSKRHRHNEQSAEPRLPAHLAKDLRDLYHSSLSVNTQVEENIAETAWRQCEAIKIRCRVRRWGQFGALTAAIVLFVWLGDALQRPDAPSPAPPPLAGIEDIDRSGQIDILDALALARHLETGRPLNRRWDVNCDGTVDLADADAIARLVCAQQPPPVRVETRPTDEPVKPAEAQTDRPHPKPPAAASHAPRASRLDTVDIYVDTGEQPLAAYQLELTSSTATFRIVAVKGGEHPAFARSPHYDPTALSSGRMTIAAFNTGNDLPTGRTHIASVHGQIIVNQTPHYHVQLHLAATANGKKIPATATCQADQPQYGR